MLYNAYRSATNIFAKKYSHLPLETLLKGYFGETLLRDAITDVLITAAGDDRTPIAFGKHDPYGVVKMWEASRATSAAPTYFEACSLNINGG